MEYQISGESIYHTSFMIEIAFLIFILFLPSALFRNPSVFSVALNLHFKNAPWSYVSSISYKDLVKVDMTF